jgi:hypothetical protein
MSIRSMASAPHLHEVELVRFIDREGSAEEQERWDAHVQLCGACRDRVDALRLDSEVVSRWLVAADFEPRPVAAVSPDLDARRAVPRGGAGGLAGRSSGRVNMQSPWLKAAIFVLFLAAPLAAFPGVREWVADRVTGVQTAPPPAPRATAATEDMEASPRIRFVPAPGTFALVLDAVQARGTLAVDRVPEGDEAVLDIMGSGPLPDPVISARGIRIGNMAATTASYALKLPGEVDALSVTIGGSVLHLDARDLDRGAIIPLDRPQR